MTNPFAIAMEGVNLNPNGDAGLARPISASQ
jgi:hypothetical protein